MQSLVLRTVGRVRDWVLGVLLSAKDNDGDEAIIEEEQWTES